MKPRIVVDTNLWIRALLGGPATLPLLEAWRTGKFLVLISQPLLDELEAVSQRPRLRQHIDSAQARTLVEQLRWRGQWVEATAVPPRCRDPKDHPVLATAISGQADAIVSGDGFVIPTTARRIGSWPIDSRETQPGLLRWSRPHCSR